MTAKNSKQIHEVEVPEVDLHLKRAFDDLLQKDVPDRFLELIAQLREKEELSNK